MSDAFEELSRKDQEAAIDAAIAVILLGVRIPTVGKELHDYIATEFTSCHGLPRNVVKYAFRSLGQSLFKDNWTLIIQKSGKGLTTKFAAEPIKNGDSLNENAAQGSEALDG